MLFLKTQEAELVLKGDYYDDELDTVSIIMLDNFTRVTDLDSLSQYVIQSKNSKVKSKSGVKASPAPSPVEDALETYKVQLIPDWTMI